MSATDEKPRSEGAAASVSPAQAVPPVPPDQASPGTPSTPVTPSRQSVSGSRRSLSPGPPSSRFHPSLPNLPPPPPMSPSSPSQLRKRKASQDLITNPLNKELKFASDDPSLPPVTEPVDLNAEKAKKMQNAITRTIWTLIMIVGFVGS